MKFRILVATLLAAVSVTAAPTQGNCQVTSAELAQANVICEKHRTISAWQAGWEFCEGLTREWQASEAAKAEVTARDRQAAKAVYDKLTQPETK